MDIVRSGFQTIRNKEENPIVVIRRYNEEHSQDG